MKDNFIKEVNKVFKPVIKKYYLGKIIHYTPYFYPTNFNRHIISVRKLQLNEKFIPTGNKYKDKLARYTNLPMVRRNKYWIVKLFKQYWYIEIGWPIKIHNGRLGWKDKYESPRFEWNKFWIFYFFYWQFAIHWIPSVGNSDRYWEMVLWWYYYHNKDLNKAREKWPWVDVETQKSTWNNEYLK